MKSVQDFGAGERHSYYNYVAGGEPQIDGGANVDGGTRGGYTNISYSEATGPIVTFHATQENAQAWTFFAKDREIGAGAFGVTRAARDGGDEYIWPKGGVARNGRVNILMRHRNEDANNNATSLMYTTGIEGDNGWEVGGARVIGTLKGIGYCVATSPVSNRTALIFPSQAYPAGENARFAGTVGAPSANNDVLVFESEDGENWNWDQPTNATHVLRPNADADHNSPFFQGDTLRPIIFVDGCYDSDDNLHVVFSSASFWEMTDPNANPGFDANKYDEKRNFIWHWDRESDQISMIAAAHYTTNGSVGVNWRQNISFPSLGATDDGTIYCAWTQYPQDGDRAANNYISSEVYAACSLDGGVTWSVPINLTGTHANGAAAGECASECWVSLAARVDDYLHISYVFDRDAGAVVQGEGAVTENPFYYHKVARDDIPTSPLQLGMDFHVGLPPQIAVNGDGVALAGVPGGDPVSADYTIGNPAENSTGLRYVIVVPENLANSVTVQPEGGRIAAGGSVNVIVTFAPAQQGQFDGELLLYHNAPGVASPIHVAFSGIAAAGFGDISGTVTELANGASVAGASIVLTPGNRRTTSDDHGQYSFDHIPAWNYTVHCTVESFITSVTQVQVDVNGRTDHDIALKFATLQPRDQAVEVAVSADEEYDYDLRLTNNGNGAVSFRSSLVFPGAGDVDPFVRRLHFTAGQIVGDSRLNGALFAGDHFYVSGGNSGRGRGLIYKFDRDGNSAGNFQQFVDSPWGMRDLAFDGQYIWGGDGRSLAVFDLAGNLIRTVQGPLNPSRGLAWDPDRNILWVCDIRSQIIGINGEGQEQARFAQPDSTRLYGVAYYGGDPDGFPLYFISSTATHPNLLYKVNPATHVFRAVADLPIANGETAGGIEITSAFDPYSFVITELMQGNPDAVAVYQLGRRTDWVSLSPEQGNLAAGASIDATLHFDTHGMPIEQRFQATARFDHNGRGAVLEVPLSLTVTAEGGQTRRTLSPTQGWSLQSLNIEPGNANIVEMTQPLVDDGLLALIKDGSGHFYVPGRGFNNIENWSASEGYQFKMLRGGRLDIAGRGIAYNHPISLTAGWQLVAYYPRAAVAVETALGAISEQLLVAKDGFGNFYLPAYNFNNMDPLREGQGYYLKVNAAVDLTYELGGRRIAAEHLVLSHFDVPDPTDRNMSLLLTGLPESISEVAAFTTAGAIVGSGVVGADRRVGLAVWGGEEGSAGLQSGKEFMLRGWSGDREVPLNAEWIEGTATFEPDGIAVGKASLSEILPTSYKLHLPYPNPFNATTRVTFDLPHTGPISIVLYDSRGCEVRRLAEGQYQAGSHAVLIQTEGLTSGIYFCRFEAGEFRQSVKAVLLK